MAYMLKDPYAKPQPTAADNAASVFGGTAQAQAGDYNDIMNRYRQFISQIDNSRNQLNSDSSAGTYAPNIPTYQISPEYQVAIKNLGDTARTGGYSDTDIANMRERGISPIRSVYANAQENLDRQRRLQGGYSPNFAAVSAKMARELSSQLSDQTTAVNAQIAQQVANNKIAASTHYAADTLAEQGNRNQFNLDAARMANEAKAGALDFATKRYILPFQEEQAALAGMRDLFGTRPGFTETMGDYATNAANTQAAIQANNQSDAIRKIGMMAANPAPINYSVPIFG